MLQKALDNCDFKDCVAQHAALLDTVSVASLVSPLPLSRRATCELPACAAPNMPFQCSRGLRQSVVHPSGQSQQLYADPDPRTLSRSKFNYGPKGDALTFRWHKGAFVCEDEIPSDYLAEMSRAAGIVQENDRFMECLAAVILQVRHVSHASGPNYAPKKFEEMPEARGMNKEAFKRAMNRLLSLGEIEANQPVQKYANRTVKYGLARKGQAT